MTDMHPTDTEIQLYVLENENGATTLVEHIKHCTTCSLKATEYSLLCKGIGQQEIPAFDFDLATRVLQQLPEPQRAPLFDNYLMYAVALICIALTSILYHFFGNILLSFLPTAGLLVNGLLITAVLAVLLFLVADMYRKYQKKMKALSLY